VSGNRVSKDTLGGTRCQVTWEIDVENLTMGQCNRMLNEREQCAKDILALSENMFSCRGS
jgi:hypothetical protein